MKKLFTVLLLSLTLPFTVLASEFEQGKHYDVISQSSSTTPEVAEFFSFYCPHCAKFEPIAQRIEQQLPTGAEFNKIHVDFIRAAPIELQNNLARAYVAAARQNKQNQVVDAIFQQIHEQKQNFNNPAQIRQLAIAAGVNATDYDADINSFPVINAADYMKQQQNKYSAAGVLTGVPTLIVNAKYRINLQNIDGDFEQNILKLIDFLIKKSD